MDKVFSRRFNLIYLKITVSFLIFLIFVSNVFAFTLTVQDKNGNPVSGFRWLLEEDTTHWVNPGVPVNNSIGVNIHNSYNPVVDKGHSDTNSAVINALSNKRYYVSVLPDSGYTLSGAPVAPGQTNVKVIVNPLPLPTAQISIKVFEDNNPINNIWDNPVERGLENFIVTISDLAGPVSKDVFGNPLGTTYLKNPDGSYQLDGDGNPIVDVMGNGVIKTNSEGIAYIKNIAPGKYGVIVTSPTDEEWYQTSTIEGTPTIDAWVQADEPKTFIEGFGKGAQHVMFGFVRKFNNIPAGGTGTIAGKLLYNHFSRPPKIQGFHEGPPITECWVGLNDLTAVNKGLYAWSCNDDSTFTINNVPPGTYQLVYWDRPLDALFGMLTVVVPPGGSGTGDNVNLGNILGFRWFGTLEGTVFYDANENGFRDPGEMGIPEQTVNIRFRDGSLYQTTITDINGEYGFPEVFPFFKWLVVEVDFARFKATGMTTAVDYGGAIPPANGWIVPSFGKLNPQPQATVNPNTGNNLSRTETGQVLTQAMHLFLNQTNIIDWGKKEYGPNENGGISGIVYYSTTRAENDPRYGVAEPWEPGVPRVVVNLYRDYDGDGVIDDVNDNGIIEKADVDNYPFGNFPGPEDKDWNGNGRLDYGDAIQTTITDSWDDNKPTGCIQTRPVLHGKLAPECFDNFGTWNQVRPGVFDGGYAFNSYFPTGKKPRAREVQGLPTGTYIVEVVPPKGYEIVKEEDKNVDFGENYTPSTKLLPPICVGDPHLVPNELSLFPGVPTFYADQIRPLCDRKQVQVSPGRNTASDFFIFTEVPKAARNVGFVNNDLTAEFNANTPNFGEKASPSWIPVSYKDYLGNEVNRVYSDEYGSYNALVPSTFTANIPAPSGMSPNMITIVLNDPYLPDGSIDPFYDPSYSVTPWTFQFMPGTTTYTDTPLVPVGAFAGFPNGSLDVNLPDKTPVIASVLGPNGGPVACNVGNTVIITSAGFVNVPNPQYNPNTAGSKPYIIRDYGFGNVAGTVTLGGISLNIISWTNYTITATIPSDASTGEIKVNRGDSKLSSTRGVNFYIDLTGNLCNNGIFVTSGQSIQSAIDNAPAGATIFVGPGTYKENLVVYKPLKIIGSGEATIISANPTPSTRLANWHQKIKNLLGLTDTTQYVPKEAPGFFIMGNVPPANGGAPFTSSMPSSIENFVITGAISGGGIYVDRDVNYLTIKNNIIKGNQGIYGGGIVIGTPTIATSSNNNNITIINNTIVKNSGVDGGGGINIYSGADDYLIQDNIIMANFSRGIGGGGILHYGLSNNGTIENNKVLFNEAFFGGPASTDGGGIYIGGEVAPGGGGLTDGSGNVKIIGNLVQGNLAGSGMGGGIRLAFVNGQDVDDNPADPNSWYGIEIYNNFIVNNVAAYMGGGISLQDAPKVRIVHNTIANNDSTATALAAFTIPNSLNSAPQPAGIVSNIHSLDLRNIAGFTQTYSDPVLINNIIWQNRSFYNDASLNGGAGGLAPNPTRQYWDLAVTGITPEPQLNPQHCILTDTTGYASTNISSDPKFIKSYKNRLLTAAVLDEGGNFISVRIDPLIENAGDYHIQVASPARDKGDNSAISGYINLSYDIDGMPRPNTNIYNIYDTTGPNDPVVDIGADEVYVTKGIALLTPIGGEVYPSGSAIRIAWAAEPLATKFNIYFSPNNGRTWQVVATNVTGNTYNWTSVPVPVSNLTNCLIRVIAYNLVNDEIGRAQSGKFTIEVVKLIQPNGGETYTSGQTVSINWTTNTTIAPVAKVTLQYNTGGLFWKNIVTLNGNPGTYNWTIPAVSVPVNKVRVRVILRKSNGGSIGIDVSDSFFTINPVP